MSHKICPICGTPAHPQARECSVCGASLESSTVIERSGDDTQATKLPDYDFHFGETDLAEHYVRWRGGTYIMGGILVLAALACVGVLIVGSMRFMSFVQRLQPGDPSAVTGVFEVTAPPALMTNTVQPTLFLPTVTASAPPTRTATPTVTLTPTQGPCMQTVQAGDSLIGLVSRCGHRDLDVIPLVLELNNLDAPELIQVGQTLEIPWPTPTEDPAAAATETPQPGAGDGANTDAAFVPDTGDTSASRAVASAPTLPAGVAWHEVVKDETIISIAFEYGADLKILSELNPEVTFSQCDFGEFSGGTSCVVNLYIGQRIRVPAPTLTPTLSPTPSGSETPTPTVTPTYNAPSALSPSNRALFQGSELVTLRWVASGTLGAGQTYRVQIDDLTSGATYSADTPDLFFILPVEWQSHDGARHDYEWTVSVIDQNHADTPLFSTEPRIFTWESADDSTA